MNLARNFLTEEQLQRLEDVGDVDFAYATSFGRFRTSVVRQRLGVDLVFRIINTSLRTLDELKLPPVLKKLQLISIAAGHWAWKWTVDILV